MTTLSVRALGTVLAASITICNRPSDAQSQVICWGRADQCSPPTNLVDAIQVSAGSYHSLALKIDGSVVAWGWNNFGQISTPESLDSVSQVSAGSWHSLALRQNSTVVAWGRNDDGQCNVPAGLMGVTQVAAGAGHTLCLRADGSLVGWGAQIPPPITSVKQIATHISWHSAALLADNSVVCWGLNDVGQCTVPADLGPVQQIAVGERHTMALLSSGTVRVWGSNSYGQLNIPTGLANVKAISGGGFHSIAMSQTGNAVCWGSNTYGQSSVPPALSEIVQISGGYEHSIALKGPPTQILGVQPISGPASGGTSIILNGINLPEDPTVLVGGSPATNVVRVSPTRLTAVTPAGLPGMTSVSVGNSVQPNAFYYRPECGSDLDQNGEVDAGDISIILLDFGPCYSSVQASDSQNPPELLANQPLQAIGTAKQE
jgi:IPT/TIG domain/Regulator of chromosome condensation (RCC1) repeat